MGATGDVEQPRGPGGAERGGPELGDAGAAGQLVLTNPWNIMIKHRQVQRRGRRSQMTTSFTDPAISMDLLRAVLQPSINEEIQTVFNKYMKFFQKAALNVRDNVGEEVDAEQLIQEACRSCLEQVRSKGKRDVGAGASPLGSAETYVTAHFGVTSTPPLSASLPPKRGRQAEEECALRGSPIPKKRKGRPPGHILSNDRATAGMVWKPKSCEPIRREATHMHVSILPQTPLPSRLPQNTEQTSICCTLGVGMQGHMVALFLKEPPYLALHHPQDKHKKPVFNPAAAFDDLPRPPPPPPPPFITSVLPQFLDSSLVTNSWPVDTLSYFNLFRIINAGEKFFVFFTFNSLLVMISILPSI
ncbi:hypothetical protein FD754_013232 [Muntiacus muntjak]|uniref:Deoxynucleotidyltransferase terminal-interacting protein 1 n=1 Tax=Muntiacus muntjak TaxID=9888 RepID=A0A5N3VJ76_MUNMU|nr:hypothetical protein FD754_013232 [Muntiacus muntjak]